MFELSERATFPCGVMPGGTYGRHAWTIRNAGSTPLRIRTRYTEGRTGFSLWQGVEHRVEAGDSITVHLTWLTPEHPDLSFASYITLWTNDPLCFQIHLRVVGQSGATKP